MRALPLLLTAGILLALAVPTADATTCDPTRGCSVSKYGYCVEGNAPCPGGFLVCATIAGQPVACVWDPCATANCWNFAFLP
jgi:hypothetical protein